MVIVGDGGRGRNGAQKNVVLAKERGPLGGQQQALLVGLIPLSFALDDATSPADGRGVARAERKVAQLIEDLLWVAIADHALQQLTRGGWRTGTRIRSRRLR
jgi:hypothetical protein